MVDFIWYAFMTVTIIAMALMAVAAIVWAIIWRLALRGKLQLKITMPDTYRFCGEEHDQHDACSPRESE